MTIAGPAWSAVAVPVSTKMPVPIIAPIPRVIRLVGPSARRRLCSPVSWASSRMRLSGLVASRLAIQFSLARDRRGCYGRELAILKQNPPPQRRVVTNCSSLVFAAGNSGDSRHLRVKAAVPHAIAKVEEQTDKEPYPEAQPVGPAQTVNHGATDEDAKCRCDRYKRRSEFALQIGPAPAQDPYTGANQNEGKQRSNAGHLAHDAVRQEGREQRGENEEQHVRFPRRLVFRVHLGEDLGHQAVFAHGIEDARLTEQHDQDHR